MPVLPAGGGYGDGPKEIEGRIRASLAAWRAGGPGVAVVAATAWSVNVSDLASIRRQLADEPDVEFVSPAQALACVPATPTP
jgi:hypothetical protein